MSRPKKSYKQRLQLLKKFAKRFTAYSAAAAATVVSLHSTANAEEVVWDIPDVTVGDAPGQLFDMVSGASTAATAASSNSSLGSIRLIGYYSASFPNAYIYTPANSANGAFVGSGSDATRLGVGATIGASETFGAYTGYPSIGNYGNLGNWAIGERGFVGIRFDLADGTHYGWAEVSRPNSTEITMHAFGYNDEVGEPSQPVPEPSSIMLLAAGAAGLAGWRRKRSRKAA